MRIKPAKSPFRANRRKGLTLLELVMAITILLVLSSAAIPIFRFTVIRQREWELRRDLREMRNAIDRYKVLADENHIQTAVGSQGYPPDLDTLVKGVQYGVAGSMKVRFLRRIPIDPMTGRADWAFRSIQDDPDTDSWSGDVVFDVHSRSQAKGIDGTTYSTW